MNWYAMSFVNSLTVGRLIISPLFLLLYLYGQSWGLTGVSLSLLLLLLLTISELSDLFDGILARRWDQVSDFGKIVDPMADSVMRITMFLAFTAPPIELPIAFAFLFLYRDLIIGSLRTLSALRGKALAARTSGKLKAIFQAVAGYAILLGMLLFYTGLFPLPYLQQTAAFLTALVALFALASGVEYLWSNRTTILSLI